MTSSVPCCPALPLPHLNPSALCFRAHVAVVTVPSVVLRGVGLRAATAGWDLGFCWGGWRAEQSGLEGIGRRPACGPRACQSQVVPPRAVGVRWGPCGRGDKALGASLSSLCFC